MSYKPISRDEADAAELAPKGKYPFTVHKAEDVKSKAGAPMLKLALTCYAANERNIFVYDYILTEDNRFAWKFRHFADSIGLTAEYESGKFPAAAQIEGREGFMQMGIQKAKDGYPAKNTVSDYLLPESTAPAARQTAKPSKFTATEEGLKDGTPDESIPF